MELRFLAPLLVVFGFMLALPAIAYTFWLFEEEDLFATELSTYFQAVRLLHKYVPEVLSFAYYIELNDSFPTASYQNTDEVWNVPPWFDYPPGGTVARCESLGCTIWNLSGGTSRADPCPSVKAYSPDPPVMDKSIEVTISTSHFRDVLERALSFIVEGDDVEGVYGLNYYSIPLEFVIKNASVLGNNGRYRATTNIKVVGTRWNVEKTYSPDGEVNVALGSVEKPAYCICKDPSGKDVVLARYRVVEYVVNVRAGSKALEELLTEDNLPYLRYFDALEWKVQPDGTLYNNCVVVIP